jgi:hypothetical protein
MAQTDKDMNSKYKETSKAGLAISRVPRQRAAARSESAARCGAGIDFGMGALCRLIGSHHRDENIRSLGAAQSKFGFEPDQVAAAAKELLGISQRRKEKK